MSSINNKNNKSDNNEVLNIVNGKRVAVYYDSFSAPEIVFYREDSVVPKIMRRINNYDQIELDEYISLKFGRCDNRSSKLL